MKVCVVGAGAIGGFVAARLAKSGNEVSVILRNQNLKAVQARGLRLIEQDGTSFVSKVRATDKISEAGIQDLVVLAVKSHQVAEVAADIAKLFHHDTRVVTMQNGIPWWFFQGMGGEFEGRRLASVDPTGQASTHIPRERIIGSVVYPAAEVMEPGVVKVIDGNRFSLGEPGARSDVVSAVSKVFIDAGFKAPIARDIRAEIMVKVLGNMSFNPVSALTHATLEGICLHFNARALIATLMAEGLAICDRLGIRVGVSIEQRIAGAQAVGHHKTSMLQDVEAGRRLELEALVASMVELGQITGVPTPQLQTIYALADLLAQNLSSKQGRLALTA